MARDGGGLDNEGNVLGQVAALDELLREVRQWAASASLPAWVGEAISRHDRQQVPHAGYHGELPTVGTDTSRRPTPEDDPDPFFEGWYFRLCLPEAAESFAFMYSIEDPHCRSHRSGGAIQVLGPNDELAVRSLPDVSCFWAASDRLALGHWGQVNAGARLSLEMLPTGEFFRRVTSGYQVGDRLHQGCLPLPGGQEVRWLYRVEPVCEYGLPQARATMGWLSYLPVFEPGWQILMAYGRATGWVEWQGRRYEFERVPAYAEKNWGGSFPQRWFWLQCNVFDRATQFSSTGVDVPLSLVCAGALRDVLWWQEEVGMAALHWGDRFFEFVPENSAMRWQVSAWGRWRFEAETERDRLTLEGWTYRPGRAVMVPTAAGMQFACRDTAAGTLSLKLWQRSGQIWELVLDASSGMAGLEVGGEQFVGDWERVLD